MFRSHFLYCILLSTMSRQGLEAPGLLFSGLWDFFFACEANHLPLSNYRL
jgi:hypothetical protein